MLHEVEVLRVRPHGVDAEVAPQRQHLELPTEIRRKQRDAGRSGVSQVAARTRGRHERDGLRAVAAGHERAVRGRRLEAPPARNRAVRDDASRRHHHASQQGRLTPDLRRQERLAIGGEDTWRERANRLAGGRVEELQITARRAEDQRVARRWARSRDPRHDQREGDQGGGETPSGMHVALTPARPTWFRA